MSTSRIAQAAYLFYLGRTLEQAMTFRGLDASDKATVNAVLAHCREIVKETSKKNEAKRLAREQKTIELQNALYGNEHGLSKKDQSRCRRILKGVRFEYRDCRFPLSANANYAKRKDRQAVAALHFTILHEQPPSHFSSVNATYIYNAMSMAAEAAFAEMYDCLKEKGISDDIIEQCIYIAGNRMQLE